MMKVISGYILMSNSLVQFKQIFLEQFLEFVFLYSMVVSQGQKPLILTCVPKHEPPSHLPPHNISLGHPHAPAPGTVANQASLSMGFSRLEYWSGLPFPSPGDPTHGSNLCLLHCRQILYCLSHQEAFYWGMED